jgi:trk system potassium uptake protein TrkA
MNVLIIGGGKVGAYLAAMLLEANHRVTIIELRPDRAVHLQQDVPTAHVVVGSGTQPATLEAAGIRQTQVLAVVTGIDETNLVAASLGRFEFRVPRVVMRVNNPKNAWMCTPEMGVDVALNQADIMAHLIAEEMSLGDLLSLLKLNRGQYTLVEEKVKSGTRAVGKTLRDLQLPDGCLFTAVIREGVLVALQDDMTLLPDDDLLAIVPTQRLKQFAQLLG